MDNNLFYLILLSSKKEPCACITNLTCCRRAPRQVTPACLPQVLKQLTSTFLSSSFWSTHVSHLQWIFYQNRSRTATQREKGKKRVSMKQDASLSVHSRWSRPQAFPTKLKFLIKSRATCIARHCYSSPLTTHSLPHSPFQEPVSPLSLQYRRLICSLWSQEHPIYLCLLARSLNLVIRL